jgi:hypothetical protein
MNTYYQHKEARVQQALASMTINTDPFGTFALVPSTSNCIDVYSVTINETGKVAYAERCTCPGNAEHGYRCTHMISTDRLLQRTSMHLFRNVRPCKIA